MTGALGIEVGRRSVDGTLFLALDDHTLRIAVHPGEDGELLYTGWLVQQRTALNLLAARLEAAGVQVEWFDEELREARCVRDGFRFRDPIGSSHEIVYAPSAGGPLQLPARAFSLAHVVLGVEDPAAVEPFYTEVLGMRVSDYIRVPWGDSTIDVTFLRVGDGRHHSFALQAGLGLGLEHFNLQVANADDVGILWDRCRRAGVPIVEDLGRHSVSAELSFYVRTPSGVLVECGTGLAVLEDETWVPRQLSGAELWGHEVLKRTGDIGAPATSERRGGWALAGS